MSCKTFPIDACNESPYQQNPAIQLFGNRFFSDQTPIELLIEFLLIAAATKRIDDESIVTCFPAKEILSQWTDGPLEYAPKARLNLKLFSFLGISKLDSRHNTHIRHYQDITRKFIELIDMPSSGNKEDVVRALENLFLGYQGAGGGRTWCAQSFLPIGKNFIAGETIWKAKKARAISPQDWEDLIEGDVTYFDTNQHLFLARGGEVLYLQICNALKQSPDEVRTWLENSALQLTKEEQCPETLLSCLEEELQKMLHQCPATVNEIARLIDESIEPDTSAATDLRGDGERFVEAGWCPVDSWQEGYLFAVDLLRLCRTNLSIIDRIYLLEIACAVHVIRSMGRQSARARAGDKDLSDIGYLWAFSAPEETRVPIKRVSHHSAKAMEKMIFEAIRNPDIKLTMPNGKTPEQLQKKADSSYAGKLFLKLAKRIGLIVPRRGRGERFVLNEQILRFLVLAIVPPGGRLTYDTFKKRVTARFGMVFDAEGLAEAARWSDFGTGIHLPGDSDFWLQDMLKAAGLLMQLSDSCSMVINPSN